MDHHIDTQNTIRLSTDRTITTRGDHQPVLHYHQFRPSRLTIPANTTNNNAFSYSYRLIQDRSNHHMQQR